MLQLRIRREDIIGLKVEIDYEYIKTSNTK